MRDLDPKTKLFFHTCKSGDDIDMYWMGRYTMGYISSRGTRVWIDPDAMFYFQNSEFDSDFPDDLNVYTHKHSHIYDRMLSGENLPGNLDAFHPEDYDNCNHRFTDFEEFLIPMENIGTRSDINQFENQFENNLDDLDLYGQLPPDKDSGERIYLYKMIDKYTKNSIRLKCPIKELNLKLSTNDSLVYMTQLFSGRLNLGIIYKYNELLSELKDAYSLAREKNASFRWW